MAHGLILLLSTCLRPLQLCPHTTGPSDILDWNLGNVMDALVYEDTPLATYFEGDAIPYELPQITTPPHTPFAPYGLPDFKNRLNTIRRSRLSVSPSSTEQLLERFRYVIVASQLLTDEGVPQAVNTCGESPDLNGTSILGASITASVSFLAALAVHLLRTRRKQLKSSSWFDICVYSIAVLLVGAGVTYLAQRQYTKHVQKSAIQTLSRLVGISHRFDATVGSAIRFIQEIEIVARGYELSLPLPPISRLEDRQTIRRCQTLRSELAAALRTVTILMVESHDAIQQYISDADLQRYHDVYEISMVEFSQVVGLANSSPAQSPEHSLKELRFAVHLYSLARGVFLCDLLALKSTSGLHRLHQWRAVLRILREVEGETLATQEKISTASSSEEWGTSNSEQENRKSVSASSQGDSDNAAESHNHNLKTRMRRFDDLSHSIRALNAKMHLLKEEMNGLLTSNTEDAVVATSLGKHYESLGMDIRSLVLDWERGRNTMLLNLDNDLQNMSRYSRSSSSIRGPLSPSPSLGGTTVVDGGPAEALRLLTGETDSDSNGSLTPFKKSITDLDEEVFEAVAIKPARKRMSIGGMSREEKIARLQEDRRKRATVQEQADNTTNMLRELRMVIKHRPGQSISMPTQRVSSI